MATSENDTLLHGLLEAAVDAIIIADAKGQIVQANPSASLLFEYATEDMIGQSVNLLMPAAMASLHDGFMSHHIKTGETSIIGTGREVEGQRKDGSVFPLHLSVGHAEIDGKRMFIGILHDMTQRNATEAALARSQRLDAIGQMTGGIAHDFNNMLTVVIGNLELLEMRDADEKQMPLIKEALDAAEIGAELTARLMVFAGRSNLKPVKTSLRAVCEDTLSILRRTLGAQYEISTEFEPDLYSVLVDPMQLQSALMNLALNARDAMGDTGELLISAANVSIDDTYLAQEIDVNPGEYVRLSVSDDGAGMDTEAQKRAFEPFFTTKGNRGGSGLGLAMVYGFVRQSGGHITLYSEEGLGTSFGIYFPALAEPNATDGKALRTTSAKPLALPGRGQTVLVVEDNPKVRKLSIERISDLGFEVEAAGNGDAAYTMLKSGMQIDIVFSDLVMPGNLNGYDLAARIETEFPHIKVLLTSGYASDVVTDRMAHGTKYEVLHKPFRQSDLVKRLQALLGDDADD